VIRLLHIIKRFTIATVLAVVIVTSTFAQEAVVVTEGEEFDLGVVPIPGESYVWHVYTDHTLETGALPPAVVFVSGNTGATVTVLWDQTGNYYYTVTAFGVEGCMNLKVGLIRVDELKETPSVAIKVNHNPICPDESVTFKATATRPGADPIYQWFKNDVPVGDNLSYYIDNRLKNKDVVRCDLTNTTLKSGPVTVGSNEITMIVENVLASFSIRDNVGNVPGRVRFENNSIGAKFYYWNFGNGSTSYDKNPVVNYSQDGTYRIKLVAINALNCIDTCSYPFTLLFKGLYIPNAFAPTVTNGLGGQFKPVGVNLKRYRIEVYDNWGHLLWESNKLDSNGRPVESWDGTCNGELMPQGTYMWKASAEFVDGTVWQGSDVGASGGNTFGTVTILR